jgi:Legionella pneumophila major outer membrane protein precursor
MRKVLLVLAVFGSCAARFCDYYGGVEALVWKPAHCPIPFVRGEDNDTNPDTHEVWSITGDYDWGFRLTIGGLDDCRFTDLAYHWVETKDQGDATRPEAFGRMKIPGWGGGTGSFQNVNSARAHLRTRYQGLDWRVGYSAPLCGAEFRFYGDIRWTDLDLYIRVAGPRVDDGNILSTDLHSSYNAGGFGAGVEGIFPLWCKISLGMRVTVSGLMGRSRIDRFCRADSGQASAGDALKPTKSTTVNPMIDARLELSRDFCLCSRSWTGKVGYELDYIMNALTYWTTVRGDEQSNFDEFPITSCQDFGYGGIYFGISASF